ncbi:MAG: hypothetical protein U0514_04240 [Candidatus Andersenbacteria bacterium]
MFRSPLLFLRQSPRKVSKAVRTVMLGEDFVSADSGKEALMLRQPKAKQEGRLFVVSGEGEWSVVAEHDEALSQALASAIAGESGVSGFFVQPGDKDNVALYEVLDGQRAEVPTELKAVQAEGKLKDAGLDARLISFAAREHIANEEWKKGNHRDLILGFHAAGTPAADGKSEVERALAAGPAGASKKKHAQLTFDQFLEKAIGNPRTRAIAKAQVEEQLKKDGYGETLKVFDPQPEGHYCERFDAESFSFTSSGPYVWFDWHCDEACEPVHEAERAFPDCSLRFSLETSEQL